MECNPKHKRFMAAGASAFFVIVFVLFSGLSLRLPEWIIIVFPANAVFLTGVCFCLLKRGRLHNGPTFFFAIAASLLVWAKIKAPSWGLPSWTSIVFPMIVLFMGASWLAHVILRSRRQSDGSGVKTGLESKTGRGSGSGESERI